MGPIRCSMRGLMAGMAATTLLTWAACLGLRWTEQRRVEALCQENLRQIGRAMHLYLDKYGHFPTASVRDAKGRAVHSWRVLLLEFLDPALHGAYDFNEPWDGPRNRLLAGRMPAVYACPTGKAPLTDYAVVVGPETVFPEGKATRITEILDGASHTVLVVEASGAGIPWMEPRDLPSTRMSFRINDPAQPSISSRHREAAGMLFADGQARQVRKAVPASQVKALVGKADAEFCGPCSY